MNLPDDRFSVLTLLSNKNKKKKYISVGFYFPILKTTMELLSSVFQMCVYINFYHYPLQVQFFSFPQSHNLCVTYCECF